MKCPACEFIFFDGRDICPKCLLDLRAYKKSMGIAISNPDTPYKELIKQRLNSSSVKVNPITPHSTKTSSQSQIKKEATPANANSKPTNQIFGYFSQITQKIFDKPQRDHDELENLHNSTTNSSKASAPQASTTKPLPIRFPNEAASSASKTVPQKPDTTITELKVSAHELAKEIEKISAPISGPKIIDFSGDEDTIDDVLNGLVDDVISDKK